MPICSYLVFPFEGATEEVATSLARLPGCEVAVAENREVLILVTESNGKEEERDLQKALDETAGIRGVILAFGDLDPEPSES